MNAALSTKYAFFHRLAQIEYRRISTDKMKKIIVVLIAAVCFISPCFSHNQFSGMLPVLTSSKIVQISSYDKEGKNKDFIQINPRGRAAIMDVKGAGSISRIWLTVATPDPYYMRTVVIRMFWDGEENPSVEAPVGDFFGVGFAKYVHYNSLYLGMSSGGFYTYFPMPFEKSARIEIHNDSPFGIAAFYFHIQYYKLDKLPSDTPRFHAKFKREKISDAANYILLDAKGKGFYTGTVLSMKGTKPDLAFLEGDELIYVDGENFPSIYGTGTEDYFNSGWYFNQGTFASFFHGLTIKDEKAGMISAYRFHILDAIPFQSSLKVTVEHGAENSEPGDYSSVAYWYQTEPHIEFAKFPTSKGRLP